MITVTEKNDKEFKVDIITEYEGIINLVFYADGKVCEDIEVTPNSLFEIIYTFLDERYK